MVFSVCQDPHSPSALRKRALLVRPGANMKLGLSFVDQQDFYTVWARVGMIVSTADVSFSLSLGLQHTPPFLVKYG